MHPLDGGMIDLYGNFSDQHEVMRWGDDRSCATVRICERESQFYMNWNIHISRHGGHAGPVSIKCKSFPSVDEALTQARKEIEDYLKEVPSDSIQSSIINSMQMQLF